MKIKLCGVADHAALQTVAAGRPDAVGFVLARSVRQVVPERLAALVAAVPGNVQTWAVFREPTRADVRALAGIGLTGVQAWATWSGDGLADTLAFLPVFRDGEDLVDRVRDAGFDGRVRETRGLVGAFVVDAPAGGGTGEPADRARATVAAGLGPMVLAGGLDPHNVAEAVRTVRPYGVDVSSGIEDVPGHKERARVRAFVDAARGAADQASGRTNRQ